MKKVKAAFRGIVIFLLCVIEIYPLFWMLTASFKKQAEWSEKPAYALNDGFYFQKYRAKHVNQLSCYVQHPIHLHHNF